MAEMNRYYELLELEFGALEPDVKAAYRALVKRWHPDQFADAEQKQHAEEEIKKINEAYQKIKAFLASSPSDQPRIYSETAPSDSAADLSNESDASERSASRTKRTKIYASGASAAEVFYQTGADLAKAGQYEAAIAHFRSAIRVNPDYAEAYRHRGFVYSLMGLELGAESDLRKAKELGLIQQKSSLRPARAGGSRGEDASEVVTPTNLNGQTWECIHPLSPHEDKVTSLRFNLHGKSLISASKDGLIQLWNPLKGTLLCTLAARLLAIASIALSANGEMLASSSTKPEIKLWHLRTATLLKTLTPQAESLAAVVFHPQEPILLAASKDGSITFWDLRSGKLIKGLSWHTAEVSTMQISPDGQTLAIASHEGSLVLWNLSLNRPLRTLSWQCGGIVAMAFTADSRRLILGCGDQHLRIWDLASDRLSATLAGHTAAITSVSTGQSRDIVASGSGDRTIRLWNIETQQLLCVLEEHEDAVTAVDFLEAGRILASGSADGSILIWRRTD
ncbi:MAG: hypothetical protein Fur0046_10490 [Cyanobacteria bacterium J069]|nr:MAG: tetratricopeptide repeat protein [Cyanobacteria bacterium J069]